MPETSKITFNVNDLQRQHTGQRRRYDNVGLARLINSPAIQERVKKGDLLGYYGHWPRKKFGMQPREGGMDGAAPISLKPAIRTIFLAADANGNITHQAQFLDTQEGKDAYDLHQNKVGGFSAAMTTAPKGITEIPVRFYGFDYVLEPNFSGNRGYTLAFDSVDDPLVQERFDSIDEEGEPGELIHVFDSVEDELLYQSQIISGLYRQLQGDYRHVLDSVGAMEGRNTELEQTIQALLERQAKQQSHSTSRSPIFIDEQKIARFDNASSFFTADLAGVENEDDEAVSAEKDKIRHSKRLFSQRR